MKISSRIKLLIMLPILLGLVVTLIETWQNNARNVLVHNQELSSQIMSHASDLSHLSNDVALHPDEPRPVRQWRKKHQELGILLHDAQLDQSSNRELVIRMRRSYSEAGIKFDKITNTILPHEPDVEQLWRMRTIEWILVDTRSMGGDAMRLHQISMDAFIELRDLYDVLLISIMLALMVVSGVVAFMMGLRVLTPLESLERSVHTIGNGDLNHRINLPPGDEIGDLAAAINSMTERLQDTLASRDELNREIIARKTAETEQLKVEQEREDSLLRAQKQQDIILHIATMPAATEGQTAASFHTISELVADTLHVERVGIWLFDDAHETLTCSDLFELNQRHHSSGQTIAVADHPAFFSAIQKNWVINTSDVCGDARTRSLFQDYLEPHGIVSMLNSAIRLSGEVIGVISLEHAGLMREWQADEQTFTSEVAEQVAAIIAHAQRNAITAELRSTQHYLDSIIESMPSALIGIDAESVVVHWNQQASDMTDIPMDQAIGAPLNEVLALRQEGRAIVDAVFAKKTPQIAQRYTFETKADKRITNITAYPLIADTFVGVVIRIDDISDRVRVEDMMMQNEKMMSLGGLAAGFAHEINNPLGGMIQGAQNIRRRLSEPLPKNLQVAEEIALDFDLLKTYMDRRDIPSMIDDIMKAGNRAADMVANLLRFSRTIDAVKEPVRLSDLIDEALQLAAIDYSLKKKFSFRDIEIIRDDASDLPFINALRQDLEQVIINLLRNAAEAFGADCPEGRRITISTYQDGDMAHIDVTDNGPGMDQNTQRRVFEPFFTTKSINQGTGLGLSVAYYIVCVEHGGEMHVDSREGDGTTFSLELPICDAKTETKQRDDATQVSP